MWPRILHVSTPKRTTSPALVTQPTVLQTPPPKAVASMNATSASELRTYLAHDESQRPACADGSALLLLRPPRSLPSLGPLVNGRGVDRVAMPQAPLTRRPTLSGRDLRFCCADNSLLTLAVDVELPACWPQVANVG